MRPKSSIRVRRLPYAGACLGAVLVFTACSSAKPASDAPTGTKSVASSDIGVSAMAYFLPASDQDFIAGTEYVDTTESIENKTIGQCMMGAGFPAPPAEPPRQRVDNTQFPDLAVIAKEGFGGVVGVPAPPDPTSGMNASESAAYNASLSQCGQKAGASFSSVTSMGLALQSEWESILSQIDATSKYQNALAGWRSCLGNAGIQVTSLISFFQYTDSQVVPLIQSGQQAAAAAMSTRLGALYAKCLGPAEDIRDRLRAQQKTVFFANHSSAIRQLESAADDVVARLAQQYGVTISRATSP